MSEQLEGIIQKIDGNLIEVKFEGSILQGEVAFVELDNMHLKAEVVEVKESVALLQVFEDVTGIKYGTKCRFSKELLEVELGPGILSSVVDGLQNPLEQLAETSGLFLPRGQYIPPLNRKVKWTFTPEASVGDSVAAGDILGITIENDFKHHIMVHFKLKDPEYKVTWIASVGSYTVCETIAKVQDSKGIEIELTMMQKWPVKQSLCIGTRRPPSEMLITGQRMMDSFFPLAKGGTICTPGPFGAGKTVIQHVLAQYADVDIVVMCACGERAGEVVEVLTEFPELEDIHTGKSLMNRTTIICNTSSMPVAAREASVYVAMTISEYYRQMGYDVLLLADSTSRWAQALREMSARLGEMPADEGFPAALQNKIHAFYERAGEVVVRNDCVGTITLFAAISPAGGNTIVDPVSQSTLSVVGAFYCLSREFSDMRIYPSIDPHQTWTKYFKILREQLRQENEHWPEMIEKGLEILGKSEEIGRRLKVVGWEGTALEDVITYLKGELLSFCYLQQNAFDKEDVYAPFERQQELYGLIFKLFQSDLNFSSIEETRDFFLHTQNMLKNMNFLSYKSEKHRLAFSEIFERIEDRAKQKVGAK